MKLLVFGSTGQLARELRRVVPESTYLSRAEADLGIPSECAAAVMASSADVVINAAAWTAVDKAEEEEAAATVVNGAAPTAIAEACAVRNLPFLHVSSDYVFGGSGTKPYTPDYQTGPLGAYGRSKLAGEIGVRAAGGPHAILRTSWVFSAHGTNFVKTMLRLSETRDRLSVVADQTGGPTPAAAIARVLVDIAEAFHLGRGVTGTFHFSGAPDVSWADFAREIFHQADEDVQVADITTAEFPTPASRPSNSRLDCTSLEAAYGIQRPAWKDGLRDILKEMTL